MLDNTRLTWEQIKQAYPDQWVYMADADFGTGNIVSAVVVFACKSEGELSNFARANRHNLPNGMTSWYTGEPIDSEYYNDYNDNLQISLAKGVV